MSTHESGEASLQKADNTAGESKQFTIEEEVKEAGLNRAEDQSLEDIHQGLQKLKQEVLDRGNQDRNRLLIQEAVNVCKRKLNADDVRSILQPRAIAEADIDSPAGVDKTPAWESEVVGSNLLDSMADEVRKLFVIGESELTAVVLWIVHTHAHDEARISPYLWLWSPVKGCGKSNLLGFMKVLVHRPMGCTFITAAVLYRSIQANKPTLLIDEVDKFLNSNPELRGVFQDGHRRGGSVPRCVQGPNGTFTVVDFPTWAPRVMAGLNRLPAEITDRTIKLVLQMVTREEQDTIEDFDEMEIGSQQYDLKRKIVRWVEDHRDNLATNWKPELPALHPPRLRDNWRAFAAIADEAGGAWPERVRLACVELSEPELAERDDGLDMLRCIRSIFKDRHSDQIRTETLLEELVEMEDEKWAGYNDGQWPLKPGQLAEVLRPFNVKPKPLDFGNSSKRNQKRGYHRDWFAKAWDRYLKAPQNEVSQVSQVSQANGSGASALEAVTGVTGVTGNPEDPMNELELFEEQEERRAIEDETTH